MPAQVAPVPIGVPRTGDVQMQHQCRNQEAGPVARKAVARLRAGAVAGITTAAVCLAVTGDAAAQATVSDPRQLEARVERIERSLSGSSLMQMHDTELRELRGEIELQRHEIEQIKQRQRDLYLDLDRRLQVAERGAMAATAPTPGVPAGTAARPATTPAGGPPVAATPPVGASPPAAAPGGAVDAAAFPAPPATAPIATPPPGAPSPTVPATPSPRVTPPAAGTPLGAPGMAAAGPAVDPAAEQQAYRAAFDLLKGGQFNEATAALTQFLADYPNGRFADNAQYWLGESYYVSRQFDPALQAFQALLTTYPDSPKRSHALLKIGFIHDEQGRPDQARAVLTDLVQQYPQSTAASLAEKRLKRLKQP
jgi:tol-pal system protein YbgF